MGRLVAIDPIRLYDTRVHVDPPMGVRETRKIQILGVGGIPNDGTVESLVLNFTVTNISGIDSMSWLTVWPTGELRPYASHLNPTDSVDSANLVVVRPGYQGKISVLNVIGSCDLIIDAFGYTIEGEGNSGRYIAMTPVRILSTRDDIGQYTTAWPSVLERELQITGVGGVPSSGVSAVAFNLTVVDWTGEIPGYMTVFPLGQSPRPEVSNLNYESNLPEAARVIVKTGTDGKIVIYNGGTDGEIDVIVDVDGYFTDNTVSGTVGRIYALPAPERVFDSRDGTGFGGRKIRLATNETITLKVTEGSGGVPRDATSIIMNLTVSEAETNTFITVWSADESQPGTSDINANSYELARPNMLISKIGAGGKVKIRNDLGNIHVVLDLLGYVI